MIDIRILKRQNQSTHTKKIHLPFFSQKAENKL